MPKSKHRKDHKKKVAARKERIKNEKRMIEKKQREFIMDLIKKEKESGAFENNPTITGNGVVDSSLVEGPSF